MSDQEIIDFFKPLYEDIRKEDEFYNKKPFLAHYTSLDALESILKSNEIWFSNPLFMNDLEEVTFGFIHGATKIKNDDNIRAALRSESRQAIFTQALDYYINDFEEQFLLDTYVFCLSEHDPENRDGMLSMWRGYGGNGRGAALVFDMSKLEPIEDSPLVIMQVRYDSPEARFEWFADTASMFARILTENYISDEKLYVASHAIFQRLKLYALFTKHSGFKEEKEWRVVHMSDRDSDGRLKAMQSYLNGPRGVEPKLKFRLEPMEGVTGADFSLDKILASILLGPSTSHLLAFRSVQRMLDLIGKPELKQRLIASTIPLRPT
jgi:Protein of unknown function (DUF2971)